jgi:hypothetical protein
MPQITKGVSVSGITDTPVYTVPANTKAIISSAIATGSPSGTGSATLSVKKFGTTQAVPIVHNVTVPATSAVNLLAGRLTLDAGDELYITNPNPTEGRLARSYSFPIASYSPRFVTNGTRVVACNNTGGYLRVFTSDDGAYTWTYRAQNAGMLSGSEVVTAGFYLAARYWFNVSTASSVSLLTSTDGVTLQGVFPRIGHLLAIGGGKILNTNVSANHSCMTTTNGILWDLQTGCENALAGNSNSVRTCAYSGGRAIAMRSGDYTMSLDDGRTWADIGGGVSFAASAANGVLFLGPTTAGSNYRYLDTTDLTWKNSAGGVSSTYQSIAFGAGVYVALSDTTAVTYFSTAGAAGVAGTAHAGTGGSGQQSIAYGAGVFVVVSNTGYIATCTTQPGAWTVRTSGTTINLNRVVWSGTQFVVGSSNASGQVLTSPDGINWTIRTIGATWYNGGTENLAATGSLIVVSENEGSGSQHCAASTDGGVTWQCVQHRNTLVAANARLASDGTSILISCNASRVHRLNPTTWTVGAAVACGAGISPDQIFYFGSKWHCVSSSGIGSSTDAVTWTVRPFRFGTSPFLTLGGAVYTKGANGTVIRSTNPETAWEVVAQTETVSGLAKAGNVLMDSSGYYSTDGTTWSYKAGAGSSGVSGELATLADGSYFGSQALSANACVYLPPTNPMDTSVSLSLSILEVS